MITKIGERELKVLAGNNLQTLRINKNKQKLLKSKWFKKKQSIERRWISQVSFLFLLILSRALLTMIKICFTLLHVWRISPLTTLRFWRRMVSRVKYSTMTQKDGWKTKTWRLNWSLSFKLLTLRYWKNLKHFSERSSKLLCTWRSWKFSSMVCSDSVSHQISSLVLSGQKKTKMQKSWRTC